MGELSKFDMSKRDGFTQDQLVKFYNDANREVAILCNHQKAESKQHAEGMAKMLATKDAMDETLKVLRKHMHFLEGKGKAVKAPDGKPLPKDVLACRKKVAETKLRMEKHVTAMKIKDDN